MPNALHHILLLDGLRHDYIDSTRTPFLYALKKAGQSATILETFAFQTRPAYFAGLDPVASNICHLLRYDPARSPFNFLNLIGPGLRLFPENQIVRSIIRRIAKRMEHKHGHLASANIISTYQIPLELLPYFAFSETRYTDDAHVFGDRPTIFDLLRSAEKRWSWIGYPRHFGSTAQILRAYTNSSWTDLAYLHFSELDWVGHRFGPDSPDMDSALSEIDTVVRNIIEPALQQEHARVVIFGDHGMVAVKNQMNLNLVLKKLPIKLTKDYLCFLDSTQARFWFFTDHGRKIITECLLQLQGGHIISDAEKAKLGINFTDRAYGDLIYMLDGGWILHPCFFASGNSAPKGMHGYLPDVKENMTQIIIAGKSIEPKTLGTLPMTTIFDLLQETFDL